MYCGYVVELKELRKQGNADRLQLCTVFGNIVIVDLSYYEGQRAVFFPVDRHLGEGFAKENNLLRIKLEDGTYTGGYLYPEKRNIKALKLRGEKSEGFHFKVLKDIIKDSSDAADMEEAQEIIEEEAV